MLRTNTSYKYMKKVMISSFVLFYHRITIRTLSRLFHGSTTDRRATCDTPTRSSQGIVDCVFVDIFIAQAVLYKISHARPPAQILCDRVLQLVRMRFPDSCAPVEHTGDPCCRRAKV